MSLKPGKIQNKSQQYQNQNQISQNNTRNNKQKLVLYKKQSQYLTKLTNTAESTSSAPCFKSDLRSKSRLVSNMAASARPTKTTPYETPQEKERNLHPRQTETERTIGRLM